MTDNRKLSQCLIDKANLALPREEDRADGICQCDVMWDQTTQHDKMKGMVGHVRACAHL